MIQGTFPLSYVHRVDVRLTAQRMSKACIAAFVHGVYFYSLISNYRGKIWAASTVKFFTAIFWASTDNELQSSMYFFVLKLINNYDYFSAFSILRKSFDFQKVVSKGNWNYLDYLISQNSKRQIRLQAWLKLISAVINTI